MEPESRPNVLVIMTDQQRWDAVSAVDGGWGLTPNIDRLASEGVYFSQCYCTAPSCVPSRASFFNCQYPSELGVLKNGDRWGDSWVSTFRNHGYRTISVGKMHTQPFDRACGFDQRFIVENKDRFATPRFYDDWDKHLKQLGIQNPTRWTYAEHPDFDRALGAFPWPLDGSLHFDSYVGRNAEWVIREHAGAPLFLQIGFPGPHTPYDPPQNYLDQVQGLKIPGVVPYDPDNETPPQRQYRQIMTDQNHGGVRWNADASSEQFDRLRRHYAANVTLIDDWIGRIRAALEDTGLLENTIVVFLSDHGDCLGDHGHIQKWMMYDCCTRVPALVWAPDKLEGGVVQDALIQHFDIVPLMFDLAGIEGADTGPAVPQENLIDPQWSGRDYVIAEHGRCNMLPDVNHELMIRTDQWKLVEYENDDFGEFYDLRNDPDERHNRWADASVEVEKSRLLKTSEQFRHRAVPTTSAG